MSKKLNLIAPINPLGYGCVGMNMLKALFQQGVEVAFWPMGAVTVSNEEDASYVRRGIENQKTFCAASQTLRIWHQHDMAQSVGRGKRIGMPIFELDTFNDIEKHHLISLDHVCVCSKWAKDVIKDQVNMEASVVPLGVDNKIFNGGKSTLPVEWDATTIFLNVGKWEKRKGHDILPEIFNRAFKPTDNVELWMMNDSPFVNEIETRVWQQKYTETESGKNIKFLPRVEGHAEVANLMRAADCGVFPSRAEGWNLEALEMMSCGKHVIISDCTAHQEFCNDANSKMVEMGPLEEAHDGIWFEGQGKWRSIGKPQIEDFAQHMREIHLLKQTGMLEPNTNGMDTAKQFSWSNSVKQFLLQCI